jgi:hypothetical protein
MNLIQQQNYLEYANKDDLIKMMSEPVPQFPSFLVLSEIQRRTINEQNFKAMQERPTTTVAEEVVGNFMQPQLAQNQSQGLQGGTPQSATPLPDSNISAGLSGVPTAPMQMAAIGGLTGYANKGVTSLPAGSAPYPTDMPIEKLARMLGVNMYAPDGSLKDSDILDQEMRIRFASVNQPAVGNTSGLPSGSVQTSSGVVLTPRVNSTVQIPPPTDPAEQLSETVPATLGLSQGVTPYIPSEVKIPSPFEVGKVPFEYPVTGVNTSSASKDTPTNTVPRTESQSLQEYNELINSGVLNTPLINPDDLPSPIPTRQKLPDVPNIKRDYFEVSPEDRQRDIDVYSLAGLAKSIGGAKNLAELGMGVGETALGLTKIKKGFRDEDRTVAGLKYTDDMTKYGLDVQRASAVNTALSADTMAEYNAAFNIAKSNLDIAEKDKDRAISIIKNNALLKQIDATNNAQLKPFVEHFANELNLLQVKTAALRSEKENQRIIELQQYIDTMLFNASQKAGIDLNLVNKEAIQRLEFNADGTPKVK